MIDGIKIRQLKVIPDARGRLMEILRVDDELFKKFGQVYMTTILPGVIKGWHYHKRQYDTFACIEGTVKLVCYDKRPASKTKKELNEFFLGIYNPCLVQIPPFVVHAFQCIGTKEAIMINVPTEAYNRARPDEYRIAPHSNDVPYDWGKVDG